MALAPTLHMRSILVGRRIGKGSLFLLFFFFLKEQPRLNANTHVENIEVTNRQRDLTKKLLGNEKKKKRKKLPPLESPHTNQFRQFITGKRSPFAVAKSV